MEKASDGSFARITRKTAEDDDEDEDEKDWGRALNRYQAQALVRFSRCRAAWKRLGGRLDLNAEQTRCSDVSRVCEKCALGGAGGS